VLEAMRALLEGMPGDWCRHRKNNRLTGGPAHL